MFFRKYPLILIIGILVANFTGCSALSKAAAKTSSFSLETVFPTHISGWKATGEVRFYNRDNLFDLVNGQAEAFFVYGFEQVAVKMYTDSNQKRVNLEIWQSATPTNAYGLFTFGRYDKPVDIGNGGDSEPGRHLSFWQERYNVHVSSYETVDDAILWNFAKSVADKLPQGGTPPELISRFSQTHIKERDLVFFHEELSIQNRIWLGGENLLGLSPDTNGIMAPCKAADKPLSLLLIEYPDNRQAARAQKNLQSEQVTDLAAAEVQDNLLLAVFGKADKIAIEDLTEKIFNDR